MRRTVAAHKSACLLDKQRGDRAGDICIISPTVLSENWPSDGTIWVSPHSMFLWDFFSVALESKSTVFMALSVQAFQHAGYTHAIFDIYSCYVISSSF
jgi:hypothetical protein